MQPKYWDFRRDGKPSQDVQSGLFRGIVGIMTYLRFDLCGFESVFTFDFRRVIMEPKSFLSLFLIIFDGDTYFNKRNLL